MTQKRTSTGHAQYLDSFGFNVLPAGLGNKIPQVTWAEYQQQRTTPYINRWFKGQRRNYLVITGTISRLVVLDLDDAKAEQHWLGILGDDLYKTARVKTAKGFHCWWRLPEGQTAPRNVSRDDETGKWDLRGEGGLVVAPPSVHASGHIYEWVPDHGPEAIAEVPPALLAALSDTSRSEGIQARSMLSDLLAHPPEGTGSRNDWLSRVAGHYASVFARFKDLYTAHVDLANQMLVDPLDEAEVRKTADSIWKAEHRKLDGPDPSAESGWLYGRDGRLYSWEKIPDTKPAEYGWVEWANFDIRALGKMSDEEGRITWRVEIQYPNGDRKQTNLPGASLGSPGSFFPWIASFDGAIPLNDARSKGHAGVRVLCYLQSQNPPEYVEAQWLGWHDDHGFIVHDGVITAEGLRPHEGIAPAVRLSKEPWEYGMAEFSRARGVLSEVLTFHDETVCAVYGAWWAACFLKPQIQKAAGGMFPIMALEAASESGKTTGFFGLMMELAGFTGTQGSYTRAAVQSALSVHANGPVWTDDMTDTSDLNEVIRQAAFSGSRTKKDADRHTQVVEVFRAPWVLTGEALSGLDGAKALRDRVISLNVPSPIGRTSLHDPERLQWSDIEAMRELNHLPDTAGRFVQMALAWMAQKGNHPSVAIPQLRKSLGEGSNRKATKLAVIRYGARLLQHLSGEEWVVTQADAWTDVAFTVNNTHDALVMTVLPTLLRVNGHPDGPGRIGAEGVQPVFVDDDGIVWFNANASADAYARYLRGTGNRAEPHIHSASALQRQYLATADGEGVSRQHAIPAVKGESRKNVRYRALPEDLSHTVLDLSEIARDDRPQTLSGL